MLVDDLDDPAEGAEVFTQVWVQVDQQAVGDMGCLINTDQHRRVAAVFVQVVRDKGFTLEAPQQFVQLFALRRIGAAHEHRQVMAPALGRQLAGRTQALARLIAGQHIKLYAHLHPVQQVLGQQWYWAASGALVLAAADPGGAGDVQVRPVELLGEARQEAGGGDGAGLGAADVGDVGERAVQLFLVLIEQRQLPGAVIRCLAAEMGEYGVRANVVAPGLIITPMMGPSDGPAVQYLNGAYAPITPMKRTGAVEDFEGIGAFLCSDASSFISGETIKVDGGYMIRG